MGTAPCLVFYFYLVGLILFLLEAEFVGLILLGFMQIGTLSTRSPTAESYSALCQF